MTNKMKTTIALLSLMLANVMMVSFIDFTPIKASSNDVEIVQENGFMVLEDDVQDFSTIVCKVNKISDEGYLCENMFDVNDVVFLDRADIYQDVYVSSILLVTFDEDIVSKVKLNHLRIADKISGQLFKY